MSIPGFTAANALATAGGTYRVKGTTSRSAGPLTAALYKSEEPGYIDCNDFPDNITCRECGNTGPGSVICCPDDYCIINNPPDARGRARWLGASAGRLRFARN